MSQVTSRCEAVWLVLAVPTATLGLHRMGTVAEFAFDWRAPAAWLQAADPEVVVAGLLRAMGLLGCYWILGSSVIYALASLKGRAPRMVRLVTLPIARRMVDRAVAAALSASLTSLTLSPAMAAAEPMPAERFEESPHSVLVEIHHDGIPVPHLRLDGPPPEESAPVIAPIPRPEDTWPEATPRVMTTPSVMTPTEALPIPYTVARGDNLWSIADGWVRQQTTQEITDADVTPYWRSLIAANLRTLRSGDPNLIYPGEILQLPAVEARP